MEAKAIIGRFVRKLREEKRLTQDQLAAKTGITYQYLSGMENGREKFSIDILESLARALACPCHGWLPERLPPSRRSPTWRSIPNTFAQKFRCHPA